MKRLSKRETGILIFVIVLTLIALLWLFVIKPAREAGDDVDNQLRMDALRLAKAQKMALLKPKVDERLNQLANAIGWAGSEGVEMSSMVARIEAAAREGNVHIANMQPQRAVTQKNLRFFAVELQIDGQWSDIVRFLYLLQQQPNYYFLNELNLEKYSDVTGSLRGRMVISKMRLIKALSSK